MKFKAFKSKDMPVETVQLKQNRRPPIAHKFHVESKHHGTGRRPFDITPRWNEEVPPHKKK